MSIVPLRFGSLLWVSLLWVNLLWVNLLWVNQVVAQPGARVAERVVSLDYCADQFVLQFVPRTNIAALSPDATRNFSYLRAQAVGLPVVRSTAEDILLQRPDLVVRTYGGGTGIRRFLESLDIKVLQLGSAATLADVKRNVLTTSAALGNAHAGETLVRRMEVRLQDIAAAGAKQKAAGVRALYVTSTGVTSGPDTVIHELLVAAGLSNFHAKPGWHPLPLERLVYEQPEVIALAFFQSLADYTNAWSAARHPVAQQTFHAARAVPLQGAWTACGGWFLLDAVEALATAMDLSGG